MTVRYYEVAKDYLHPHFHNFINHYRYGNFIDLLLYHDCNHLNRDPGKKLNTIWDINASFQPINAIVKNQKINADEK